MGSILWRSQIDIDEDNRYGAKENPDRATAILSTPCATCGEHIEEIHFADGHRRFVEFGVCSGLGKVWHRHCKAPE